MMIRILAVVAAFLAAGYFGTMQVSKSINSKKDEKGSTVSKNRSWLQDAVEARTKYKVLVFGNGSVVIPGRRVLLYSDKPPAGQSETNFKFRALDNEPEWLFLHRKALLGLREGSQVALGKGLPNVTIYSVCDESLLGLRCKPPTADATAHPELKTCENAASPECNAAIDETFKRAGPESNLDFVEVCLMEKDEICSGIFIALTSRWEKNLDGKDSALLKSSITSLISAATKKNVDAMNERLLHTPAAVAEQVLNDIYVPIDADKMRVLLKAVHNNVAITPLIVSKIVARIHDGTGMELIKESGISPPKAVTDAADLRKSLTARKVQIEASFRAGKLSEFEKEIYKKNTGINPSQAKTLDLAKLSVDGYTPYMLAIIAGRNFTVGDNAQVPANDPNLLKANLRGETVLHLLVERGDLGDIQAFLTKNTKANIDAKDANGKRPIDWARERNFETIVNYLETLKK